MCTFLILGVGNAGTAADSSGGIAAFRGKEDPGTDERSGQKV